MGSDIRQAIREMGTQETKNAGLILLKSQTRRLRFVPPFSIKINNHQQETEKLGAMVATRWAGVQSFLIVTDDYIGEAFYNRNHQCLKLRSCIIYRETIDSSTEEAIFDHYGYKDFQTWEAYIP